MNPPTNMADVSGIISAFDVTFIHPINETNILVDIFVYVKPTEGVTPNEVTSA